MIRNALLFFVGGAILIGTSVGEIYDHAVWGALLGCTIGFVCWAVYFFLSHRRVIRVIDATIGSISTIVEVIEDDKKGFDNDSSLYIVEVNDIVELLKEMDPKNWTVL